MQSVIISDTSCLILLDKIGELDLLHQLFDTIMTTKDVAEEYGNPLPDWVKITDSFDKNYQEIIGISLDNGEASAIALANELEDCLLIIDDQKARNFALQLGLQVIGTLGILVEAKLKGLIPSMKPILSAIRKTNFRISQKLEETTLRNAGEE